MLLMPNGGLGVMKRKKLNKMEKTVKLTPKKRRKLTP